MDEKPPLRQHTPYFPDLFMVELMVTVLVVAALILASGLGYSAPLEDQADPFVTPPHAMAPWYFLFLQGLLKITPKIVGAFIIPAGLVTALVALPFVDRWPLSRRRRNWTLALVALGLLIWAVLTYLGTPAYLG
jgi:quinol-cytochrome oxidoreductase complex cytochrome b subunit